MKIINLTQHEIRLANDQGNIIAIFPPSGNIARVSSSQEVVGEIFGRPVYKTKFSNIEGLPEQSDDTYYIVSTVVAQIAKRKDVISPDTGKSAIRDESGQVIAVRSFQTF